MWPGTSRGESQTPLSWEGGGGSLVLMLHNCWPLRISIVFSKSRHNAIHILCINGRGCHQSIRNREGIGS